jgi:hypothetical protein
MERCKLKHGVSGMRSMRARKVGFLLLTGKKGDGLVRVGEMIFFACMNRNMQPKRRISHGTEAAGMVGL